MSKRFICGILRAPFVALSAYFRIALHSTVAQVCRSLPVINWSKVVVFSSGLKSKVGASRPDGQNSQNGYPVSAGI
jgi:hypothetical protein